MAQTELRYISRLLTVFAAIVVPGALAMVLGLGLRLGPSLTTILAVVFIFIAFIALAWFYLLIQRRKNNAGMDPQGDLSAARVTPLVVSMLVLMLFLYLFVTSAATRYTSHQWRSGLDFFFLLGNL